MIPHRRFVILFTLIFQISNTTDDGRLNATTQERPETLLPHIRTETPRDVQEQAVRDLISRLLPEYASQFVIVIEPLSGEPHMDVFEYTSNGSKLVIRGTTGVACSLGLQHFLKYYCHAHISWSGDQLKIPNPFPTVQGVVRIKVPYRFRYYQNACTSSYSFVWWNWTRWQREIDWMALNGINLPLAFTGQEAIWQKVYLRMGFTQNDLDTHFVGPAFLAWSRMGKIRGWGGPLPATWHKHQLGLQHKILTAMRSFGMTPVLPGFSGHVPRRVVNLFPKAAISKLGLWKRRRFNASHCCHYRVRPTDPLYKEIAVAFIKEQIAEYGTNHIYNVDTFHEEVPASSDPKYIADASKAIFDGILAGDRKATWLMQGWLFYWNETLAYWKRDQVKALLNGVPQGKMLVLDLMAELNPVWQKTESFHGQPFIWCMLHNFGQNNGFYGAIENITKGPVDAFNNSSTMIGTGLAPEGIEQNDIIYELMNEMGWRSEALDHNQLQEWVSNYTRRRYGGTNAQIKEAWSFLTRSVYNCSLRFHFHSQSVFVVRPSLNVRPHVWYEPEDVYQAWDRLVAVARDFADVETFRYDLVDVTRQALHLLVIPVYSNIVTAYKNKSVPQLITSGSKLMEFFSDMDAVLQTNQYFLLGRWLNSAKALATNPEEVRLYELSARNQITLWGPKGENKDYASKMWSGLVKNYYKKRWEFFIEWLLNCLTFGKEFDNEAFGEKVLEQEIEWTYGTEEYPDQPIGDSTVAAIFLHHKYRLVV